MLLIVQQPALPPYRSSLVHRIGQEPDDILALGSLAEALHEHFVDNPMDALTTDDVAELFGVEPGRVANALAPAVHAGLIQSDRKMIGNGREHPRRWACIYTRAGAPRIVSERVGKVTNGDRLVAHLRRNSRIESMTTIEIAQALNICKRNVGEAMRKAVERGELTRSRDDGPQAMYSYRLAMDTPGSGGAQA